ncbi:hypothetical protein [Streptomyces sp. NPDC088725]|uniref:hypothetical protein n=1 Tax=Streptomyces sp. NPDC088725 TaxID=3365873 RepID=UPI0038304FF8
MTAWQPESGETVLSRDKVIFATGVAARVAGMRWFRDTERNDIQDELTGWPEGPQFTRRAEEKKRARAKRATGFTLKAAFYLVVGILENLAGSGSVVKGPSTLGPPKDPENEVEDFPVMWAGPGTLARTLPWQLDPARCPEKYHVEAVVTDRRLVVLGISESEADREVSLWTVSRTDIDGAEEMPFSNVGMDLKIRFTDGSWCRLAPPSAEVIWTFPRYLAFDFELVRLDGLSLGQRNRVSDLNSKWRFIGNPVVTRRASGNYLIDAKTDSSLAPNGAESMFRAMGANGEDVRFKPGDF